MKYTLQIQQDGIAEAIRARYSMIIPIMTGMLYSTKQDLIEQAGGYEKITLEMFTRIYAEHPGDYGICFEYALHKAVQDRETSIYPKINEVLEDFCGIKGEAESILFGAEKKGAVSIIETAKDILTDTSKILVGKQARPTYLKRHIENIAKAFRSKVHEEKLPVSIRGLWKADIFLGSPSSDYWVGTTLKINRKDIEKAPGLRIALYPEERPKEGPKKEDNLVYCPLPYSGEFMQLFGASFQIIKQIVAAKGKQPSRVALYYEDDQAVAKWLTDRSQFPLLSIIEALDPIKQPGLLLEQPTEIAGADIITAAAPIPLISR